MKTNEIIREKEKANIYTDREEKIVANKISSNNINIYNDKNENPPKKKENFEKKH